MQSWALRRRRPLPASTLPSGVHVIAIPLAALTFCSALQTSLHISIKPIPLFSILLLCITRPCIQDRCVLLVPLMTGCLIKQRLQHSAYEIARVSILRVLYMPHGAADNAYCRAHTMRSSPSCAGDWRSASTPAPSARLGRRRLLRRCSS